MGFSEILINKLKEIDEVPYSLIKYAENIQISASKLTEIIKVEKSKFDDEKKIALQSFKFASDNVILVVDDNVMVQELLKVLFETIGIKIHIAFDGEMGVDLALKLKPDLVIMDIAMPKMDGITAIEKIRSDSQGKSIPIVILSASIEQESGKKLSKVKGLDYLAKPVGFDRLLPVLDKYLKKNQDVIVVTELIKEDIIQLFSELSNIPIYKEDIIFEKLSAIKNIIGNSGNIYVKYIKKIESALDKADEEEFKKLLDEIIHA
ncbi:MAG: response regulator [Desulfobacterales bacterium]|nr:response regulator [Desulfobacterales bacterium]